MATSHRYRWPPGTGIPKELKAMVIAINTAAVVSLKVVIFAFDFFI